MGSTNRSSLAYVAEVTAGTTPATPAFKAIRSTSNTLAGTPTRTTSDEIRADRQVTDQILVDVAAGGQVPIELSYGAFDDFLEAQLQGTWSNNPSIVVVTSDTEISDVSTTTLTVPSGGTAFKAGMLCLLYGFSTAADNGLFRVSSSTATTIVFPAASFTAQAVVNVGAGIRGIGFMGAAADITATANGLASTLLDFTTLGISVGEWIRIGGDLAASQFATAANNGWARVSAVAANAITCDILPAGFGVDAGTGKTIQVFTGDFLTTGTVQRSFTFERQQQDLVAPTYELFKGCQVDKLSLAFKSAAKITGSFDVLGLTAPAATTVRTAGATDVAAPAYGVMNAASNVGKLLEAGAVASLLESLNFDFANNLARETAIGTLGAVNIRDGEVGLGGAISAYFNDASLLNKVLNDTATSLMVRAGRQDGNRESLVIDVPQAKLSGTAPVNAKNNSRMFTGTYSAYRHPVLGYTASISRFPYLPVAA